MARFQAKMRHVEDQAPEEVAASSGRGPDGREVDISVGLLCEAVEQFLVAGDDRP